MTSLALYAVPRQKKLELPESTQFVETATATLADPSLDAKVRALLESLAIYHKSSASDRSYKRYANQYYTQRQKLSDRFPYAQDMLQNPKPYGCIKEAIVQLQKVLSILEMTVPDVLNLNELEIGQRASSECVRTLISSLSTLSNACTK